MKKRGTNGFSLIEVMVALFIIAIATLIFGYFMTPLRLSGEAQKQTQQMALARNVMDNVRNFWQDPDGDCRYIKLMLPNVANLPSYKLIVTDPNDPSKGAIEIFSNQPIADHTDEAMVRSVEVQLLDANNKPTFSLSTQIARINTAPENCP
jgi:prepilin-type N-terminal cleavage/methylation domain-containing protein